MPFCRTMHWVKIASELRVWKAQAEGMSISIIRPGVILGIGPEEKALQELWALTSRRQASNCHRRLYRNRRC